MEFGNKIADGLVFAVKLQSLWHCAIARPEFLVPLTSDVVGQVECSKAEVDEDRKDKVIHVDIPVQ